MKKIIISKITLALVVLTFAFVSAQNSATLKLTGQTRINNVGALATNDNVDFLTDGSNIDSFSIGFKAVMDNVTASVTINDSDDAGKGLKFDSAYIEVADLFDGLMTFKFFDIGYGAGKANSIRPDKGSHGIKMTVKPIDMLSIGLGYGIGRSTFYFAQSNARRTNTSVQYHAIQLDIGINNAFVPATIYFGTLIADGGNGGLQLYKNNTDTEKVALFHTSAGFTADLLAALLPGAVNLDLGVVFPLAGAATYNDQTTTGDYENQLNLVAILHGGLSDLGVEGLGLDYGIYFALDTETKHVALGDIGDGDKDSDSFHELLKVDITPSYTLGQFKFALNVLFGMVGEKASDSEAYNRFEIIPSVTWSPSEIASIKGYFGYLEPNMEVDDNEYMRLGLDYTMTIGVEGL